MSGKAGPAGLEIRAISDGEVDGATQLSTVALRDDPLTPWLYGPGEEGAKRTVKSIALILRVYGCVGAALGAWQDGELVGTMMLTPPRWRGQSFGTLRTYLARYSLVSFQVLFLVPPGLYFRNLRIGLHTARRYAKRFKLAPMLRVSGLAVREDRRGQGVGSALLEFARERARRQKQRLVLECSTERNAAYYRKRGFECYHEEVWNGVPLWWFEWQAPVPRKVSKRFKAAAARPGGSSPPPSSA